MQASDGTNNTTQSIAVTVTDVNDVAPVIGSAATANVAEGSTAVIDVNATDVDTTGQSITYSFAGGADDALFNINSGSGVVTFKSAPDFEVKADAGGNNVYDIIVKAWDGTNSSTQSIAITATDVAPKLLTTLSNINENTTTVGSVVDTSGDTSSISYGITGADDGALFSISAGGVLSFITAPDYENPLDVGKGNTYSVTITASDGTTLTQNVFSFNVLDAPAPTINGTSVANIINGTSESEAINGLGGNDTINGLDGNDIIDGGLGSDKMAGGKGDDTYIANVTHTLDIITEVAGEGNDTVKTGVTFVLAANVENLIMTGVSNITGTGNGENNTLTGNNGVNILYGLAGNDTLIGGLGRDTTTGGLGNDTFTFKTLTDSKVGTSRDIIKDFEINSDNDTIDLSAIAGVNAVFGQSAIVVANSVTWALSGANTLIKIDTTGDTVADMEILLTGNRLATLFAEDFIV